jgi:U5 snRNP protein, DIM1 family
MSYLLPHLRSGWAVDQAILNEEDRVVVIRFGHDWVSEPKSNPLAFSPHLLKDTTCMQMDEILCNIAEDVKNFAIIYCVGECPISFMH